MRLLVVPTVGAALLGGVLWLSGIPLSNAGGSGDEGVRLVSEGTEATLVVTDLAPGESAERSISISNPGSEPTRLSMTEHGEVVVPVSGAAEDALQLVVEREGVRLYAGPMGAMSDVAADQGWVAGGSRVTFTFTVSLPDEAPPLTSRAELSYTWETAS